MSRELSIEKPLANEVMERRRKLLIRYVRTLPPCAQERVLSTPARKWRAGEYRYWDGKGCLVGIATDLPPLWSGLLSDLEPEARTIFDLSHSHSSNLGGNVERAFDRFFAYFGREKTVAFLRDAIRSAK